MVAQINVEFRAQKWLADSGANAHVNADAANIHDPQPFEGTDMVGVGNGAGLQIQNSSSSVVHPYPFNHHSFFLKDILHCPNASANLLSINKFCIDNNCWFALIGSHFFVKDNQTGHVLLQGPCENGLYPIPLHPKHLNKWKGLAAHVGVKTTDSVWHQRLGHPSLTVIQYLLQKQQLPLASSLDKTRVCEACQLGKFKQLPFVDSTRCTLKPLELIHSDVWTSPIPLTSGCRYYVLFVDDYSRFTWLYPILSKAEVLQCFVKFKLLVENLFISKIKQFQSDNGGEYTSKQFKDYLSQSGILHRLSCPHTSQQNGIAERKHRHIVEVGLTLLAQSGLSPKFWVDSFLNAIYLIKRLLTHVLQQESPFSKLMKRAPDYTLLRTFGCLCYPLLRPYANHKFSFRSKPCSFIGYGENQKGYRCLDPTNNKIFFSQSVIFNETQFPAKNKSLSRGSCQVTAKSDDPLVFLSLPHFNSPEPQLAATTSFDTQHTVTFPQQNQHLVNTPTISSNDPVPQTSPDLHLPAPLPQDIESTTSSNTSYDLSSTDQTHSSSTKLEPPLN